MARSFLELQSSGRKDEIRLHYTHQGQPRMETFSHRLADGYWHRLAVSVSGGVASLYVDCKQIERRWMAAIPDTTVPESIHNKKDVQDDGKMSIWIGQRAHNFLFKVNLVNRPLFRNSLIIHSIFLNGFVIEGIYGRCQISGRK